MKVINCLTLGEICEHMLDGEPVFLIRAQDICSVPVLEAYYEISKNEGGKNLTRTQTDIQKFLDWQKANPKRMKVPD